MSTKKKKKRAKHRVSPSKKAAALVNRMLRGNMTIPEYYQAKKKLLKKHPSLAK